ncbi:MAG: hypothetical protein K2N12_08700 [Helicobacter sp.]|nr:hypothetical protein [Helicobacter sp.]
MNINELIKEVIAKGQLCNIESELVAEQILLVPHDELKRFAHDLFCDTDNVIAYKLDCKAVKYYAEQAISRKYNGIAARVCSQLLALRNANITEQNKLLLNGIVLFEGEELVDLVQNGFQHASIVQKIGKKLGGQNAALQRF